jgi:hypothetical protein
MKTLKRPNTINQQIAKSVRSQLPRDGSMDMKCWYPGELPKGGFRAIIPMGPNKENTKLSPTSGGGKKVY